jgi:hypothetical protein
MWRHLALHFHDAKFNYFCNFLQICASFPIVDYGLVLMTCELKNKQSQLSTMMEPPAVAMENICIEQPCQLYCSDLFPREPPPCSSFQRERDTKKERGNQIEPRKKIRHSEPTVRQTICQETKNPSAHATHLKPRSSSRSCDARQREPMPQSGPARGKTLTKKYQEDYDISTLSVTSFKKTNFFIKHLSKQWPLAFYMAFTIRSSETSFCFCETKYMVSSLPLHWYLSENNCLVEIST